MSNDYEEYEIAEDVQASLRMWGCVFLGSIAFWVIVAFFVFT